MDIEGPIFSIMIAGVLLALFVFAIYLAIPLALAYGGWRVYRKQKIKRLAQEHFDQPTTRREKRSSTTAT